MKRLHGWETKTIAEVAAIGGGNGFPEEYQGWSSGEHPFIKVSDLNLPGNERLIQIANHWVSEAVRKKLKARLFPAGTIVFAKVGGALLTNKRRVLTRDTIIDNNMMALTPDAIDGGYLYQVSLMIDLGRYRQEGAVPSINGTRVGQIAIDVPPLPEQRKIADILGTWDEALEKLDALIAAVDRRKQALMQQLLTGQRRLPGFSKPWAQTTFGQFLTESRVEGSDGLTAQKITVKLYGRGVLAKQERLVGSSNTKYLVRRAGQLIYSKLDFLNGAFGIIPPELDGYESTLDLPSFDVKRSADARWLLAYLVRPEFYERQVGAAAGGRIARRINPPEFLKLRLKAPEFSEQRAIVEVLDAADAELRLLRQQRAALDQQKRGLMQQLLTGQKRVIPTP